VGSNVEIRAANHDDIPAIQHVAAITWRATYAGQIDDADIAQFLDSAYSERNLTTHVSRLGNGFVVATIDGSVAGYAMAGLNRNSDAELFAIYVLPDYHGSSVGKRLWDAAVVELVRQDQPRMCCWVLASNIRARRFYERQGAFVAEEREFPIGATVVRETRYCLPLGQ
jgi:ribosomal protein S18 acetylase RimI-like enzyme